jgi:hypothetical protein
MMPTYACHEKTQSWKNLKSQMAKRQLNLCSVSSHFFVVLAWIPFPVPGPTFLLSCSCESLTRIAKFSVPASTSRVLKSMPVFKFKRLTKSYFWSMIN